MYVDIEPVLSWLLHRQQPKLVSKAGADDTRFVFVFEQDRKGVYLSKQVRVGPSSIRPNSESTLIRGTSASQLERAGLVII